MFPCFRTPASILNHTPGPNGPSRVRSIIILSTDVEGIVKKGPTALSRYRAHTCKRYSSVPTTHSSVHSKRGGVHHWLKNLWMANLIFLINSNINESTLSSAQIQAFHNNTPTTLCFVEVLAASFLCGLYDFIMFNSDLFHSFLSGHGLATPC